MRRFLLATCLLVSPLLAQDPPSASTVDELVRSAQMHATMAQRARTAQEAQQRLQLSLTSYEQALAAGAGAPVVLNQMAQLYLMSGNTERAIALFHRSLAEDPQKLGGNFVN